MVCGLGGAVRREEAAEDKARKTKEDEAKFLINN